MKTVLAIVSVGLVMTMVSGEAPRQFSQFNRPRQFFQRQEQPPAPPADGNGNGNGGEAPYQPSGWRPQGAAFTLPARQTAQPQDNYGPPPPPPGAYGPPPTNGYGPPDNTEQPTTEAGDQEAATEINPEAERVKAGKLQNAKQQEDAASLAKNTDRGLYYVYLPDGRLQRVVYMTSADLQKMAYTARVQYEDVDPVAAPIYTIDNQPAPAAPVAVLRPRARFVAQ